MSEQHPANPRSVAIAAYELVLCRADFDGSGQATIQDVFLFLTDWFAARLASDINADTIINIQDVFDFLTEWFRGCTP